MPAIDAALPATPTPGPSAPTEARPATQNAAKGQKMADGDTQASKTPPATRKTRGD